jgi:hypothetical protein
MVEEGFNTKKPFRGFGPLSVTVVATPCVNGPAACGCGVRMQHVSPTQYARARRGTATARCHAP